PGDLSAHGQSAFRRLASEARCVTPPADPGRLSDQDRRGPAAGHPGRPTMIELPVPAASAVGTGTSLSAETAVQSVQRESSPELAMAGIETAVEAARRYIIKRPRLTRLLDNANARVLMLIAPAGFGKTTLAREWA